MPAGGFQVTGGLQPARGEAELFGDIDITFGEETAVRNFKGIQRRIQRLAASSQAPEAPVAEQAVECLRYWRETGEFPAGGRISLAVYRQIVVVEELERQAAHKQAELNVGRAAEGIP